MPYVELFSINDTKEIILKILIIDIDSKPPFGNLALKKIAKFYKDEEITWNLPLWKFTSDKIFVSCIFDYNRYQCKEWEGIAEIGGTGYDIKKKLPPEIDKIKIYENRGFTTRGCIRKCPFCIVPEKEGDIKVVGDIYDFWDRKSKSITIMDNNILAVPNHFLKICHQLKKENLRVDFNQGLDMRLLTPILVKELNKLRYKQLRFSWDDNEDRTGLLKELKDWFGRCFIYVLCGHLGFDRDLEKLEIIKKIGHNSYVMRLEKVRKEKKYIRLAQWSSIQWIFFKYSFKEFCDLKNKGIL
jgi:hypothetical protein